MYEDDQYDEGKGKAIRENYEKLKKKKEIHEKVLKYFNQNHLKLYNKKLADFR